MSNFDMVYALQVFYDTQQLVRQSFLLQNLYHNIFTASQIVFLHFRIMLHILKYIANKIEECFIDSMGCSNYMQQYLIQRSV